MAHPSPFLLDPEVEEISLLSSVTGWREEQEGRFPKKRRISKQKKAYLRSEIEDWSKDPEGWRARNAPRVVP